MEVRNMSDERILWRTSSMEGKWKDGKGDVRLAHIEYYGKHWLDLRIINVHEGRNQHTRHGVRLTIEQAKEMLPRLVEAIQNIEDDVETAERKEG